MFAKGWKNVLNLNLFINAIEGCSNFRNIFYAIWFEFLFDMFRRTKHKFGGKAP